jgi:hypothetical protein
MLTFEETLLAGWNFLMRAAHGWQHKILMAPPVVFYNQVLGGDGHILLAFYAAFFFDLMAGACSALKRRVFSRKRFELWAVKLLVYTFCIIFIGLVDLAFVRALRGFHVPLLDIIVSIMLAGEVGSIFTNLQELTGRVPPVLIRVTDKLRHKAGRHLEDLLNVEGEEK